MRCDALPEQWFYLNSNNINSLANTVSPSMVKSLSTVNTIHGPGSLHPFPNQQWSMVRGGLPIDRSPLNTDQGSIMGWWKLFSLNSL